MMFITEDRSLRRKKPVDETAQQLFGFGVTAEDLREAWDEPRIIEPWYTEKIAKLKLSQDLWAEIASEFWDIGSPEENVILRKIISNTSSMRWRWIVFHYAEKHELNEIAELALSAILRLHKTRKDLEEVIRHAGKYRQVLMSALRDYTAKRKRHSEARRRRRRTQPHLKVLPKQDAVG